MRIPLLLVLSGTLALSACSRNEEVESNTPDPYADSSMNTVAPPGTAAADSALAPSTGPADLTGTVGAFEMGITNLAPAAAVANVDAWINTLAGTQGMDEMVLELRELKAELSAPSLNAGDIGESLRELGQKTTAAAAQATPTDKAALERLGVLLTQAGTQLAPN